MALRNASQDEYMSSSGTSSMFTYYIPFYYFVIISLFQRSTFYCIPFLLSHH